MAEKKVSKFQIWVTAVGFLGLLFVPSVAWVFCHNVIGDDTSENRALAKMPEISLKNIGELPEKIEEAYNDHAPFRAPIRAMWAKLNYFGFDDSTSDNVLIGKNEGERKKSWLFYKSSLDNNSVRDAQGLKVYSESEMKASLTKIESETKKFEEKGARLYYFVAPSKESVYEEFFPENVKIYNEPRTKKLSQYITDQGVNNYYYAYEDMLAAKESGQLYFRHDTHWNELGAFVGFKGLIKMIEPKYNNLQYNLGESKTIFGGDLAKMLDIKDYFVDEQPDVLYMESSNYQEEKQRTKTSSIVKTKNEAAPIKKKIMVVGDSYRSAMEDYLAKSFSEVVSLHRQDYKDGMFENYNPDIVVYEFTERYSNMIKNFSFIK